ncbi:MAG: response regulator transcription factor [Chloroflexi bacterium]|nr:response regulator transcription factor [Chloroflexota bacterium]
MAPGKQILIVDDDALMRRSLALSLEGAGYRAETATSAEEALEAVAARRPDLVLLDIGLPGIDGLEALRLLRQRLDAPVIFVTARRRELDEILGLELGADDYVTKPFDTDVLLARIRAVLRRARQAPAERRPAPIEVGDLCIDPGAHTVSVRGQEVSVAPREFDLLLALAQEAGRVVPIDDLLQRVWGAEYVGEPQVVYVHIRWLREKLERDPQRPRMIVTVRGVGYKLVA